MSFESQQVERKSLRVVVGRTADWDAVARSCVCFANGNGGHLLIGIEDGERLPPATQVLPENIETLVRRRIAEKTANVTVLPFTRLAENGGAFLEVQVPRSQAVASTTDGYFAIRIGDTCRPVIGDEILRLVNDRPSWNWEAVRTDVPVADASPDKVEAFVAALRASARVKASVQDKTVPELLVHYHYANSGLLTNLGVLMVGRSSHRFALVSAPMVQAIRYDHHGQKVNKWVWDDASLSPTELLEAVWTGVPDFDEHYELPDGMFRKSLPAYDRDVIRELLVNALVHRPYSQRGDIYLNLYPDYLEIVNPGRLPVGVTPQNILHASRRRNEGLARVFHDLELMEKEGSGFDLVYDRLLSNGRPAPAIREGVDSVHVTIQRRVLRPEIARLIAEADAQFQLKSRERITLGLLAQNEALSARELADHLDVGDLTALSAWIGRLPDFGLISRTGRTKGTIYFVPPGLLSASGVSVKTSLVRIEPHRLAELVREDLRRYPGSRIGDIHQRIGREVPRWPLRKALQALVADGSVLLEGTKVTARYRLAGPK